MSGNITRPFLLPICFGTSGVFLVTTLLLSTETTSGRPEVAVSVGLFCFFFPELFRNRIVINCYCIVIVARMKPGMLGVDVHYFVPK